MIIKRITSILHRKLVPHTNDDHDFHFIFPLSSRLSCVPAQRAGNLSRIGSSWRSAAAPGTPTASAAACACAPWIASSPASSGRGRCTARPTTASEYRTTLKSNIYIHINLEPLVDVFIYQVIV